MGGSLRDALYTWCPKWLQGTVGAKFLYLFGYSLDVELEKANQGMRAHIPTYGDVTTLATIGTDKLVTQGPTESPAAYALRLKTSLDDDQRAGTAWSVLRQLIGFMSPYTPQVATVGDGAGAGVYGPIWDFYFAGAPTTSPPNHYLATATNWNWDGSTLWYRAWVIIQSISGPYTCPTWGDGHKWGDGTAWGISGGVATATGLRAVVAQWKAEQQTIVNIIVVYSASVLTPTGLPSANPQGSYGAYYLLSGGTAIPSRSTQAAYLDGVT